MAFDRRAFNDCMRPYMSGSKTKEQRGFDMCVGAKLCAHKTSSKEEAIRICSEPKPVKPVKTRQPRQRSKASCEKEVREIVDCLFKKMDRLNMTEMTIAMKECMCGNGKTSS